MTVENPSFGSLQLLQSYRLNLLGLAMRTVIEMPTPFPTNLRRMIYIDFENPQYVIGPILIGVH